MTEHIKCIDNIGIIMQICFMLEPIHKTFEIPLSKRSEKTGFQLT